MMDRRLIILVWTFTALVSILSVGAKEGPLKVFILAGQSNMVGAGTVEVDQRVIDRWKTKNELTEAQVTEKKSGSLAELVKNPEKQSVYDKVVDDSGDWVVRDDVWIYFNRMRTGEKKGGLTVGFGSRDTKIGPELGFGHVLGDALDEPVLLIKACWGGRSLAVDFRPPSAGKCEFEFKPRLDGSIPKPGEFYQKLFSEVNNVLGNLKEHFPEYDGREYEIAGFFWHQGWNDGCHEGYAAEYEKNMPLFIADIRKELGVAELPFVIANSGFGGMAPRRGVVNRLQTTVQPAQKAAEKVPNVRCVDTRPFYRPPEQSPGTGDIEHWFSNAESYYLIGEASAEAMLELLKP